MKDIAIVGHGGLAREIAFLIGEINRATPTWNLLGYIASDAGSLSRTVGRHVVWGTDESLLKSTKETAVAIAIGQPSRLRSLHERFRQNPKLSFPNLIHPSVTGDWERIAMDSGNIVLNNASFTTDIKLGALNIINPGVTIAHDCVLGSYNLINPGASLSGEVVLADEILVGTGARVLQQLHVCSRAVIGAGAVVTRSIKKPGVYIGIPARERNAAHSETDGERQ
jgi:sugar O-acyltransferase (sialic acid O-acetyltransferase NeuD family)